MSEIRPPTPLPEIWNVPYKHADYFVERSQERQTVINALEQNGIAAIGGETGMGKTRFAAELAYFQRGEYDGVVWVSSTKGAQESCASIIQYKALPGQNPVQEIDGLFELNGSKRLWIVDDATQIPAELNTPNANRHVLVIGVTVQTPDVVLGPLETQGAEVILRRAGILKFGHQIAEVLPETSAQAQEISAFFGGNPDYLVRAGRYIEESRCGVARFASLLGNERGRESVMRVLEQMSVRL